jgi:ferredoxin--NADP+ reductase
MNQMVDQMMIAADMSADAGAAELPKGVFAEEVLEVEHYTDFLFRFRITRPAAFRFRSGEFVMIGLPGPKPVWRAYSIASPAWDDTVEFYSIKVPNGPLTSELQKIQPGDTVWMRKKSTGTLVVDALLPGRRLWMFSTGTGIAPFASLIRDPEVYEKFDQVILTHTCREVAELAYGEQLVADVKAHEFLGEDATAKLTLYNTVTRDPTFPRQGRITDLIGSGALFDALGVPPIDPSVDRGMICGSMEMLKDTKAALEAAGLIEGSNAKPGEFVVERAFVG